MERKDVFQQLRQELPALIFRDSIEKLIPGLNSRSLANHDYAGTGVKNRMRIGRRIAYFRDDLLAWLKSRQGKI